MRKKIIYKPRTRGENDHYSFKDTMFSKAATDSIKVKKGLLSTDEYKAKYGNDPMKVTKRKTSFLEGVGNVVSDIGKLAIQPAKLAVASVTGKPVNTKYSTGFGKVVGKVHDTGNKALTTTAKSFADTITGGLATKAANLVRKDEYKEKAYSYGEMKNAGAPTGIKFLDKTAEILPTVGTVAGGVVAGYLAGDKALSLGSKQEGNNMKPSGIEIGPNVLTGEPVMQSPIPTSDMPLQASGPEFLKNIPGIAWILIALTVGMLLFGKKSQ